MTQFLYNVATTFAAPFGATYLAACKRHRPLLARFHPTIPTPSSQECPIWVQACSVGEVNTARPILKALAQRWPGVPIVLTASTVTGRQLALDIAEGVDTAWLPFDHPLCMRRFVRQLRPRALVLIETELWPNLLWQTRRFGAPVVLVNGRLSDKHLGRYERHRAWLKPVVRALSAAGMQNQEYAGRLVALGASPADVHVTGNTKFDGVRTAVDPAILARLRAENGFNEGRPLLLFGSTRPGDEALAAQCWSRLSGAFPQARLVVAPRHNKRIDEALQSFAGQPVLRRSEVQEGRVPAGERVFFLDTVGELASFYALATIAVIGGSFYPGVNGHNPLESAALGVPTVFGPYMRNFVDPARELVQAGGAIQVKTPEDLCGALEDLLASSETRATIAERGHRAVLVNQGAIQRNLDLLESVLPDRE
ncbi:MAG: 3-deoxy-D-manno-octulosonic acid transferase [Nitrospiraceae bacterium]|nr:3-deoxy-D-manno-octulosonic acid transferase [Nitrospiraceae bacterium]